MEGAPITVSADGARVCHLDHGMLRVCDVPSGQVTLLGTGVAGYGMSRTGAVVVWTSGSALHRADGEDCTTLATAGPAEHALPDPGGDKIGYRCSGGLRVILPDGSDELLAGEPDGVRWGEPDPGGLHFGRQEGWCWAPDGRSVLATRAHQDQVSLHLLDLDGGWVDVHWDREIYPYLGEVRWADGSPLITVIRRSQAHGLILAVDRRTGETQVHAELADPRWVHPIPGTPRHLADGRVLVGGEIAHDGYDARCLFADGTLLTPPGLYVRRVVGRLGPLAAQGELGDLLVEASEGEPAEQHLFRIRGAATGAMLAQRLTSAPGWHTAECGGDTVVTGFRSWEHETTRWSIWHAGTMVTELNEHGPARGQSTKPALDRVTDRHLPTAVLYPPGHVFGRRLPTVLHLPDSPEQQQIRADHDVWTATRRWAEAGFAVVMVDARGTSGISPSYEKVVHRRLADLAIADQIDGLRALADKHSDVELSRVVALGTGYGGWLAALLATQQPDAIAAGIAIAPWDWATTDVPVAERYLGPRELDSEVYERHRLADLPASVLRRTEPDFSAELAFARRLLAVQ